MRLLLLLSAMFAALTAMSAQAGTPVLRSQRTCAVVPARVAEAEASQVVVRAGVVPRRVLLGAGDCRPFSLVDPASYGARRRL